MVLHPGFDDHLHIQKCMHEGLLSSSSQKQQNKKVSLNNTVLGVDYKLTVNMLIKLLYITVQYFILLINLFQEKLAELSTHQSKLRRPITSV